MTCRSFATRAAQLACAFALAAALALACGTAGRAYAADGVDDVYWNGPATAATVDSSLLTTYGVRAGSAGGDFLGITNVNFDFSSSGSTALYQYQSYSGSDLASYIGAGLAIWATSVNENPNPYYTNLYYNAVTGGSATAATTWSANPESSSWGDSMGVGSYRPDGTSTINGLEYSPDIIFGANKKTNWSNFDPSDTNIAQYAAEDESYNPTFVNNDSTNLWTQIYTLGQLAQTADNLKASTGKTTRYDDNSATEGALSYEKAVRGNLLYVASQIDAGVVERQTVAYLYCIDGNGTGYFFIPEASGLTTGSDTDKEGTVNSCYAANAATIDLSYMGTLPFVTDTFTNGTPVEGGIVMLVEDIYKSNPAVSVGEELGDVLADVDVIIYNTTVQSNLVGTSGGKNSSNIGGGVSGSSNAGATPLTDSVVNAWAKTHGFSGTLVAGSDWGTSTNQGYGTKVSQEGGMAPMLYCQRNYTTDKAAWAAWAFSKVYPSLYPNEDATYAYWVDKVYHVNTGDVGTVVRYMTNNSNEVTYSEEIAATLENDYLIGLKWWNETGSQKAEWSQYAYYTGSSRASYYDGDEASEEPAETIGIFQPSAAWQQAAESQLAVKDLTQGQLSVSAVYNGDQLTISCEVRYGDTVLEEGSDYTLDYRVDTGFPGSQVEVVVTGAGSYEGELSSTATVQSAYAGLFPDVDEGEWFVTNGALDYGYFHSIVTGYSDTGFYGGLDNVTRGQIAVILYRMQGEPAVGANASSFVDNADSTAYYYDAVRWASSLGIVTGYRNDDGSYTHFGPEDYATREELAVMICRYAQYVYGLDVSADTGAVDAMPDGAQVSSWAREGMAWCQDNGIITGIESDGTYYLAPQDTAWRASMSTIVMRLQLGILAEA